MPADQDVHFRRYFERKQREYLRTIVCDEIVEEHRRSPRGQHSEPLARLLAYFRRSAHDPNYVVRRDRGGRFQLAVMHDGVCKVLDGPAFESLDEAWHAVFLARLEQLMAGEPAGAAEPREAGAGAGAAPVGGVGSSGGASSAGGASTGEADDNTHPQAD